MRNLKRALSLVLATVMVIGMMVVGASATSYNDDASIDYKEAVDVMSAVGMIEGWDGSFGPDLTINRAGAAKLIAYLKLGKATADSIKPTENPFNDVDKNAWYAGYVAYCKSEKLLEGYNGNFYPEGDITAYGFAKLLLGALGYRTDVENLTGDSWEVNTATLAIQNNLFAGNDGALGNAPMTREEACLYAFNALKATMVQYAGGTDITVGDIVISGGYTRSEKSELNGDFGGGNTDLQLCEHLYKDSTNAPTLKLETGAGYDADAFGRPAHSWTYKGNTVATYVNSAPVKTYTEGFTTKEVTALKNAGYTLADNVVINNNAAGFGVDTLASRSFTGAVIELYNTDNNAKTIEQVVIVESYLTKVTEIVSTNKDATKNYITLAVYNPWAAGNAKVSNRKISDTASTTVPSLYDELVAEYAKNDYLLTYWVGGDSDIGAFISAEDASSVVGTVTSTKMTGASDGFNGTFTADGVTYKLATPYAEFAGIGGALTLGKEYTLYLDANGYVMGAALVSEKTETVYNYAIYLDGAFEVGTPADNLAGKPAKDAYENAQLFTADGETVVLGTAFTLNADLTFKTKLLDGLTSGDLVVYTLNAAGKISSIAKATDAAELSGEWTGDKTFKINGTDFATSETVIFVMKNPSTGTAGKYTKDDVAVYTGYAAIPAATYTAGVGITKPGSAGAATAKVATLPDSKTDAQYIVLTDDAPVVSAGTKDGEFKYTWNAIVDGVETEVFYLGDLSADDFISAKAGELCTVTFNATTGSVADITRVTGNVGKIPVVDSDYYYSNAISDIVYTDADTVYYQLDGTTGAASITGITGYTAVDSITMPAAGDTFEVYEYYVPSHTGAADIVFFFVYQP